MNSFKVSYSHRLLHRFQPKPLRCRQDVSAFALTYSLRLRSCRVMGAFVISPSPSRLKETLQTAGPPRSTGVTPLRRYYGPVRHPHAFGRFPGLTGYTTYLAPMISQPGREGFTNHSMCPCHRAVASTPPRWDAASVRFRHPMLPSPSDDGLGPRILHFRGYICVYCCYGPVTRNLPRGDLVDGLSGLRGLSFPAILPSKLQGS